MSEKEDPYVSFTYPGISTEEFLKRGSQHLEVLSDFLEEHAGLLKQLEELLAGALPEIEHMRCNGCTYGGCVEGFHKVQDASGAHLKLCTHCFKRAYTEFNLADYNVGYNPESTHQIAEQITAVETDRMVLIKRIYQEYKPLILLLDRLKHQATFTL